MLPLNFQKRRDISTHISADCLKICAYLNIEEQMHTVHTLHTCSPPPPVTIN
jgi:hypothetical protein